LEDLGVYGRIKIKWAIKKYDRVEGVNWFDLAVDRDMCRALMKTGMDFRFP
jgi:hypothetical protein